MPLCDLLQPETIVSPLVARERFAVIAEFIDALVAAGSLPAARRDEACAAVVAREQLRSTGVGSGVAVPHAQLSELGEPLAALGVSPAGVDFDAADGKPVHLVVLLLSPTGQPPQRIATLAGIARLFQSAHLRQLLIDTTSATEILTLLASAEETSAASELPRAVSPSSSLRAARAEERRR